MVVVVPSEVLVTEITPRRCVVEKFGSSHNFTLCTSDAGMVTRPPTTPNHGYDALMTSWSVVLPALKLCGSMVCAGKDNFSGRVNSLATTVLKQLQHINAIAVNRVVSLCFILSCYLKNPLLKYMLHDTPQKKTSGCI